MADNPQGPNVLANEFLGSILLNVLGLPSPGTVPIVIEERFLSATPKLLFQTSSGDELPETGVHLGVEFLGVSGFRIFDWVPGCLREPLSEVDLVWEQGIAIFDIWANQQDARQRVFRQNLESGKIDTFFIDNGHLFGGPAWANLNRRSRGRSVPSQTAVLPSHVERWVPRLEKALEYFISQQFPIVPSHWFEGNIASLKSCLHQRLVNLKKIVSRDMAYPGYRASQMGDHYNELSAQFCNHGIRVVRDGRLGGSDPARVPS